MGKIVLVTGATSGFGKAIAEKFASEKFRVIITGRRLERLQELKKQFESEYGASIHILHFDVRSKSKVDDAIKSLPDDWNQIDILVNNAGLALGRDFFDEADMDDWETMIDTNLKGLVYVTRAVLPGMIENGNGYIVNIGSIAGKEVYEKGNMYCATKHAVQALSKAMRIDLLRHKIRVTAIHPGAAETEFSLVRFKGDEESAGKVYEGYQPLQAEDIAGVVYYCTSLPDHFCINELELTPTAQASAVYLHK